MALIDSLVSPDSRCGAPGDAPVAVAVAPEFRRKNTAKKLVSEAEKWFEENGLEVFTCVIERDNTASVELFQKLRYEEWDVRYFSKRKSWKS